MAPEVDDRNDTVGGRTESYCAVKPDAQSWRFPQLSHRFLPHFVTTLWRNEDNRVPYGLRVPRGLNPDIEPLFDDE